MHRRRISLFVVLVAISVVSSFIFGTQAFGISRPTCSGDICGTYGGGAGAHVPQGSGVPNRHGGQPGVAFAYFAVPTFTECSPTPSDISLRGRLNIPVVEGATFYEHYLGAAERGGEITVPLAGWEGTPYFGDSWSSLTGDQPAPPGTPAINYFPPGWRFDQEPGGHLYCLPLKSGGSIEEVLNAAIPEVTFKPANKAVVGMKKASVEIKINETSLDANPAISLSFELESVIVFMCDDTKREKEAERLGVPVADLFFYGCTLSDSKKAPITFKNGDFEDPDGDHVKTASIPVKFKKKGRFSIAVGAVYKGTVRVGPDPLASTSTSTNVTKFSSPTSITVRSSTAVNRKG